MNCKQARRLMQEIADGTRTDHTELDQHLAQCPGCRLEWQALQRIEDAVASIARCEPPAERLERATVGALQTIARQRSRSLVGLSRLGWAAAAVLLIAVFVGGIYAGRTVWPREVTVKVPEVREKIVNVPVVQEKVVIKRVPVYRTRIVYRDREVAKPLPVVTPAEMPAPPTPDQFVTQPETEPLMATVTVFQETRPAQLAEEVEPEQLEPTQGRREQPGSTITGAAAEMVIAQNIAH